MCPTSIFKFLLALKSLSSGAYAANKSYPCWKATESSFNLLMIVIVISFSIKKSIGDSLIHVKVKKKNLSMSSL